MTKADIVAKISDKLGIEKGRQCPGEKTRWGTSCQTGCPPLEGFREGSLQDGLRGPRARAAGIQAVRPPKEGGISRGLAGVIRPQEGRRPPRYRGRRRSRPRFALRTGGRGRGVARRRLLRRAGLAA